MTRLYLSMLLTIGLFGCAAGAPKIDEATLNELERGRTTLAQVIGRFGRPSVLSRNIDGTQTAAYMHAGGRSSTPAVVPLIAAMAGKSSANLDATIFSFDTGGVLTDYNQTRAGPPQGPPHEAKASAAVNQDKLREAPAQGRRGSDPWTVRIEASGQRENR